jgi:peptide-methionine (R)-S-oxide reductase
MGSRRQFLVILASACGLVPVIAWLTGPSAPQTSSGTFPVEKSDEEWRRVLTPEAYRVLRGHGTERPFSSPLNREHREGVFTCAGCARQLFASSTKFDSGTGWPSFWRPLEQAVGTTIDRSLLMVRTEVHCAGCGGHLGHVFTDGPQPTGLRYCMNGIALDFEATL